MFTNSNLFSDEFTLLAVFYGALVIIIPLIYWIVYPIRIARRYLYEPEPLRERQYIDYKTQCNPFTKCLADESTIYLSLIIPAYNEEKRIRAMLEVAIEYLVRRQRKDTTFDYEIIVVDDSSQDDTIAKVKEIMRKHQTVPLKLLALKENHGKGGAVRKGMLVASGLLLLMADADGATKFEEFDRLEENLVDHIKEKYATNENSGTIDRAKLLQYIDEEKAVVCGSRAHLQQEAMAHRHWIRNLLMYGFHFAVSSLCIKDIKDTQCGFKLFTRKAVQLLFPPLHIERWAFDVELLYLAKIQNVRLSEVPVEWHEIEGSKLNIISAALTMLRELILIRICYATHIWNVTDGLFRLCPITSNIHDEN